MPGGTISDVLGQAQARSRARPGPFEPGPAQPMLWALCGLGPGSRFLRPEARAQAQAFNPFILHRYPSVVWHDLTGWPPDVWELNMSFFALHRSCLVTSSHTARPYGLTRCALPPL